MDVLSLNKQAWNAIGENLTSPYFSRKKCRKMFERFCKNLPERAHVLDIGCGTGIPFTTALAKRGFAVTGIDLSSSMIAAAKQNVPQATFLQASMTAMKFRNKFDGIFSGHSMLCLDPKRFALTARKIAQALRPHGYFFIALNEPGPTGHRESENYTTIQGQKMYSRPYTEQEIRKIFSPLHMKMLLVERETLHSKIYGMEYTLLMLMQKKS